MANRPTDQKLTGAIELFSKSYDLVKRNLQLFFLLFLLPAVFSLITAFSHPSRSGNTGMTTFNGFSSLSGLSTFGVVDRVSLGIVFVLIILAVAVLIQAMLNCLVLQVAQGKTPTFDEVWTSAKKYWFRLFCLSVVVGLVTVAGLILFIVPGLIFLRRYYLAKYVLIDKDVPILEAMRQSSAMTKHYSGWVWSIIGVTVVLEVPSIVPFIGSVISVALSAMYSVAPALRYEELKKVIPHGAAANPVEQA